LYILIFTFLDRIWEDTNSELHASKHCLDLVRS
jgi:hypothetical protein